MGFSALLVAAGCGGNESAAADGDHGLGGRVGSGGDNISSSGAASGESGGGGGLGSGGAGGDISGGSSSGASANGGESSDGGMGGDGTGGSADPDACIDFECPDLGVGPCCLRYEPCSASDGEDDCSRICTLFTPGGSAEIGFVLHKPQEVATLAASQCSVLNGSLEVSGLEIETLHGLETLEAISGEFVLKASNLTSIEALMGLVSVGGLSISDSNSLTKVDLPALTTLSGDELSPLPGSLNIVTSGLETLRLPALEQAGSVTINVNPELIEINMDSLKTAGDLTISSNPSLSTLNSLPSLEKARARISINPLLPQCEVDAIASRVESCTNCDNNGAAGTCN